MPSVFRKQSWTWLSWISVQLPEEQAYVEIERIC